MTATMFPLASICRSARRRRAPTGIDPIDPSTITSLLYWHDATVGLLDDGSSFPSDEEEIFSWEDKIGGDPAGTNVLVRYTDVKYYLNQTPAGGAAVRADGVDDDITDHGWDRFEEGSTVQSTEGTIISVATVPAAASSVSIGLGAPNTAANYIYLLASKTSGEVKIKYSGGPTGGSGPGFPDASLLDVNEMTWSPSNLPAVDDWATYSWGSTGSAYFLSVNGVDAGAPTVTAGSNNGKWLSVIPSQYPDGSTGLQKYRFFGTLLGGVNGNYFAGQAAEHLMFSTYIGSKLPGVEEYFRQRHGHH